MGGGNDAHIHLNVFLAANTLDDFVLQHAQQLDLGARADVANLIQKDCALVGLFESPKTAGSRAGEGAGFVSE